MIKADFVLKLGGSAITHKDAPFSPNMPVIETTAREIARSNSGSTKMILVYGGGSFGHYAASKHLAGGGGISPNGIAEIRAAMLSLTKILTEVFLWQGLPILCINPSSVLAVSDDRMTNEACLVETVSNALECGLIPAVGGDVVLEKGGGGRIVSGDYLARLFAKRLGAGVLLFGTDVDGVLGKDGSIRRELRRRDLDALVERVGRRKGDVTGGMAGKLAEVRSYLDDGGKLAIIFNLTKEATLSRIISGGEVECTYIRSGDRRGDD